MTDAPAPPRRDSHRSPRAVLAAVGFAVFVAADDLTVVTTMLRPITNDLGLTIPDGLDEAAWLVNVYLIAFVAVMPIAGRLSDVIGRRRLLLGAFAVFGVGTIVIPLAETMTPFLVGRVLTALGGGAMLPVALAIVGDAYDEARRTRALGILGAIETLGWVWGPLYGAMLVRFLDWRWQFWLNIPLTLIGMALILWAMAPDGERRADRLDVVGATLAALTLITLDLALLGNAEIQSVSGLEELQGTDGGVDFRLLLPVAVVFGALFVRHERRTDDPLVPHDFLRGRAVVSALVVNFLVGAALVVAMVDVPIFVNAVEVDLERSAVVAGWLLAALTAAMTVASYAGGPIAERAGRRLPALVGLALATAALLGMGSTWDPAIGRSLAAIQLGILGLGLGLTFAPTTDTVVSAAPPHQRGGAASTVMVVRLLGLSVGLAALTAWALDRFNRARADIDLPPITDPGFEAAVTEASAQLTAAAIAETFTAGGIVVAVGLVIALLLRSRPVAPEEATMSDSDPTGPPPAADANPAVARPEAPRRRPTRFDRWLPGLALGLALCLAVALVAVGVLFGSLRNTQDEVAQLRADLDRVEQGAAGSAIVAGQVLEISRQLAELEPTLSAGLDEAISEIEGFGASTLDFTVPIEETVVIDTEIVIERDFSFPVNEVITIDQTVDTTIEIDTGLGFAVPVDVSVPVEVDVPIDLDVEVPINETVPVQAEVPVNLDVPISIDIAQTELAGLATQLAESLRTVQELLASLS